MGVKISDLPQANTSTNSDLFAIVQAGETKKVNKSVVVESVNNNIANEYSTASTYNVGDMCIYQGSLYVCVTAITTAEEWNATNWQRVTMGEQLINQITNLNNNKLDKTQILNSQSTSTTDSYSANYVNGQLDNYVIFREKTQDITQQSIPAGQAINIRVYFDDIEGYTPICHLGVVATNNAGVMATSGGLNSSQGYITPWLINCTSSSSTVSQVVSGFLYIRNA